MSPVLAYHLILSAYGFWLPNDPRGSWSDLVRRFEIYQAAGPATKTTTRRSVASRDHDHAARLHAKAALKYPPVRFTGEQALAIAAGFADYAHANHRIIHAAALMPDHVHLVVARSDASIKVMADQFKARATTFLNRAGLHPLADHVEPGQRRPAPWARNHWSVFLDSPADVRRAVRYVEENPIKAGLRPQRWSLVTPYAP